MLGAPDGGEHLQQGTKYVCRDVVVWPCTENSLGFIYNKTFA